MVFTDGRRHHRVEAVVDRGEHGAANADREAAAAQAPAAAARALTG
ncbi:hypothetical protein [Kitasatospora sp. NPDC051914]